MKNLWEPYSLWDGLVLWLRMDEKSGYTVFDHSAYRNHGRAYGARPTGHLGWHFDGVDDYVEVPDDPSLGITDAITIEVWVKNLQESYPHTYGAVVGRFNRKTGNRFLIKSTITIVQMYINGDRKDFNGAGIGVDVWKHIVFVWKSDEGGRIYVNGIPGTLYSHTGTADTGTDSFIIGGDKPSPWYAFNGTIALVRIYERALSAGEIWWSWNLSRKYFGI